MSQASLFAPPPPPAAPPLAGDRWVICPDTAAGPIVAQDVTEGTWEAEARAMARRHRRAVNAYTVTAGGSWQVKGRVPDAR